MGLFPGTLELNLAFCEDSVPALFVLKFQLPTPWPKAE